MKKLLILIAIISSFDVTAQTASEKERRFQTGVYLSYEVSGLIVRSDVYETKTTPKSGFSMGVLGAYQFNERNSIHLGLGYGFKRYFIKQDGVTFGSDIDPQMGFVSSSTLTTDVRFKELQIPVLFKHEFKENNWFITGGLEFLFLHANKMEQKIENNDFFTSTTNQKSVFYNVTPVIGAGYQFRLSNQLQASVEPTLKMYIFEHMVSNSSILQGGLRMTVFFKRT